MSNCNEFDSLSIVTSCIAVGITHMIGGTTMKLQEDPWWMTEA